MRVLTTQAELADVHGCVFVPTMGALHEGHLALVRASRDLTIEGRRRPLVVVSIFVNPTQFTEAADLERYPRMLEKDVAACEGAGADVVFAPGVETVYPPGMSVPVPPLPAVATEPNLEDGFRPGHFAGVCQVVKRLFDLVRPSAAVFGEKDWQQLKVIEAMSSEQRLGVEIVGHPTVREPDGLAMSSRNVFLDADARRRALGLSRALCEGAGAATIEEAEVRMAERLKADGVETEYAVVRDARTLMPAGERPRVERPMRMLIAARVGKVRLIDNAAWAPAPAR